MKKYFKLFVVLFVLFLVTYSLFNKDHSTDIDTIEIKSIQSLDMTGQFNTNMYMALIGGVIVAFPFIFWELKMGF